MNDTEFRFYKVTRILIVGVAGAGSLSTGKITYAYFPFVVRIEPIPLF
ncbi:MAG: hypothetical protein HYY17_00970 [Planctomycetes bacterium]|nr:hypothetical protein [Planctomycetota bacterium]